jgi:hypothetical protein
MPYLPTPGNKPLPLLTDTAADPMSKPLILLWSFILAAFTALVLEAATGTYWGYAVFLVLIPPPPLLRPAQTG